MFNSYTPRNKILSPKIYYITVYTSTVGITGVMGEQIYSGYSITEAQRLYIKNVNKKGGIKD